MEDVKVSVIIPVYNVERYFPRCMQSVAAQTYSDYEVILVDDGSTDGSGSLCDQYAAEYTFVHSIHQSNQGQAAARNHGVQAARGEYVCFIDSDDFVSVDHIEKLMTALELHQADMAVIKMCVVPENREVSSDYKDTLQGYKLMDTKAAIEDMLYGKSFGMSPCAKLYRREMVEKYPYPVGVWFEDAGTTYKIVGECQRIVFVDSIGYFYVRRAGSTLRGRWTEKHSYGLTAAEEQLSYVQERFPAAINAAKCSCVYILMDFMNLLRGHSKEEKKLFKQYRSEIMSYAGGVLADHNVPRNTKIKICIVSMGYYPMCAAWRLIDYMRSR